MRIGSVKASQLGNSHSVPLAKYRCINPYALQPIESLDLPTDCWAHSHLSADSGEVGTISEWISEK